MSLRREPSWDEAIKEVLQRADGALHYNEIANRVEALGIKTHVGSNPKSSVGAILSRSLADADSPYLKVDRGVYALKSSLQKPIPPEQVEVEAEEDATEDTGAIRAFGMFWHRALVNWSGRNPPLLGRATPGAAEVNFAEQVGVYLLHDRDRVIYVGRAGDTMLARLKFHTTDRLGGRWDRFSWFGLRSVGPDGRLSDPSLRWSHSVVIETMEAVLIESLEPALNRRRGDNLESVE